MWPTVCCSTLSCLDFWVIEVNRVATGFLTFLNLDGGKFAIQIADSWSLSTVGLLDLLSEYA